MSDVFTLEVPYPINPMTSALNSIWSLAHKVYGRTELTVTGKLLSATSDPLERARIKMLFDFIFLYALLLLPLIFLTMYAQDYVNLVIQASFISIFFLCAGMMMAGICTSITGTLAAVNTLLMPMVSSYANDLDVSLMYAVPWMMACLLGYFVVGFRTAIALGITLVLYLGLLAVIKLHHVPVFLAPAYSAPVKYLAIPFIMAGYLLICLRVWGQYYRNLARLEEQYTRERQQEFSALVTQNLTKQFLLVKGLSRSGKNEYLEGNMELLDECFSEIEKQCDTAIHYLDGNNAQG